VGEIDQGSFTRANRRRAKYRWQQNQSGEDEQLHDGGDGEKCGRGRETPRRAEPGQNDSEGASPERNKNNTLFCRLSPLEFKSN